MSEFCKLWLLFYIYLYNTNSLGKAYGYRSLSNTTFDKDICSNIQESVVKEIFNISGLWVSTSCEVNAGSIFVLRSFDIANNGKATLLQHFYKDPFCSKPVYTLKTYGKLNLKAKGKSWMLLGAGYHKFKIKKVLALSYSKKMLEKMARKCHFCNKDRLNRKNFQIFNKKRDCNCLDKLKIVAEEILLMKIQKNERNSGEEIYELFTGDIGFYKERKMGQNTYNQPLEKMQRNDTTNCKVCQKIINSRKAPKLKKKRAPSLKQIVKSTWVSKRCELRPFATLLKRKITLEHSAHRWSSIFVYFHDRYCEKKKMTLYANGTYKLTKKSRQISDAYNAIFILTSLNITSHDDRLTSLLNGFRDASEPSYVTGTLYNVTSCGVKMLNIKLPQSEYDIVSLRKVDGNLNLFTGKRPRDGKTPNTRKMRPTYFQDGLQECGVTISRKKSQYRKESLLWLPRKNNIYSTTPNTTAQTVSYTDSTTNSNDLGILPRLGVIVSIGFIGCGICIKVLHDKFKHKL